MPTTTRQNNLILNQDWTRIYQTFKSADFKSYDFENLRRVMITYLRENFPEDFNDYIESSEYLALIDAIAFLGQSLAFRIDLASRENFIELADRKESVLRIARMLNYNAKRNIGASGLLKFTSVTTTEDVIDSNGKDLSQQLIVWNDSTNANWYEQFNIILNATMIPNIEFGRSQGTAMIQGILTDQYRFNTVGLDVPIYTFTKTVASRSMAFEVVSTTFDQKEYIYEEPPVPANQLGFIYRNDIRGPGSHNTGFYLMFKQGSLELADFTIDVPTPNDNVAIDSQNINNDDIWLYKLNSSGVQVEEWNQVSALVGNNIAYNSLAKDVRNIYSVITREEDKIELMFADGVYGNLPQGEFRSYYRVSNGLNYAITPTEISNINITVPYINSVGAQHYLKIGLSLQDTVTNAAETEDIDAVRANAPAQWYTQNRMITAEDYNLAPLSSSQDIIKVKSINRISSGISRNFDIIDATGKYSSLNVFAADGYIYQSETERFLNSKFNNRIEIINFIKRKIEPLFKETDVYNFYITKFNKLLFPGNQTVWVDVLSDINYSSGYFKNAGDDTVLKTGAYTSSTLKYAYPGALIKFIPTEGNSFKNGKMVPVDINDPDQTDMLWAKLVNIVGDGTNDGLGELPTGQGTIEVNERIPSGAIVNQIVPRFVNDLPPDLELEMTNQMMQNLNFGLRYDTETSQWIIITSSNLNLVSPFSLGSAGDVTSKNIDSSWMVAFIKEGDEYFVRIRAVEYIFGSIEQNRFYFDANEKSYNDQLGRVVKDKAVVLGVNSTPKSADINCKPVLHSDIDFEIDDTIKFNDGYESTSEIKLAFSDSDSDGVIDNPDAFDQIVGTDQNEKYIFFNVVPDKNGNDTFILIENKNDFILIEQYESSINILEEEDGQLIYFYDPTENYIKRVDRTTNTLVFDNSYKAAIGRRDLKFQYIHNASVDRRIDPSVSNIIDIFLLPRSYDEAFRSYLAGNTDTAPEPLSSDNLQIMYGSQLSEIKAISDDIIYHPVNYKILFGKSADEQFRALFKVVKNSGQLINDNDLKVNIISAINTFFDISNWDFGDTFYITELSTYVLNTVAPDISNMVITPRQLSQSFGSLFEIQCRPDEIFISSATVDDIVIIPELTANELNSDTSSITRT